MYLDRNRIFPHIPLQFLFFKDVSDILKDARVEQDHPFIVGGDFNIIVDHALDGQGGGGGGGIVKGKTLEKLSKTCPLSLI